MRHISPSILDPDHINSVVIVQVFDKDEKNPGTLKNHTMRKYVGVLESYSIVQDMTVIKIVGLDPVFAWDKEHHVELYNIGN